MSQWDKDLTWYNKMEYQRFEAFINISADRMIQGEPEQGPFCYRGIESDPQQAIRLQKCAQIIQIVLAEQERFRKQNAQQHQQLGMSMDGTTATIEQALAQVYQVYSIPALQYSQQLGMLDERAISTTLMTHPKSDNHAAVGSSSSGSTGAVGTKPPAMAQQSQQQEPPRRRIQKFNSMGHDGQERKRIQRFLSMGGSGSNGSERKLKSTASASTSTSTINRSTSADRLSSHLKGVEGANTSSSSGNGAKPAVAPRMSRFTMLTRSLSSHSGFSTLEEDE
jgi:hypothetical protein